MPMYDYLYLLESDTAITVDAYSTSEVDFGVTNPNVAMNGNFGMHIIVTTSFVTTVSIDFKAIDGAATAPTTHILAQRNLLLADLVAGKHYYIPFPPSMLRYVRAYYDVNTNATAGKVTVYLGEPGQGAL
jgi:hypothetical protein